MSYTMTDYTHIPEVFRADFITLCSLSNDTERELFLEELRQKWLTENMPTRFDELMPQLLDWFDDLKLEVEYLTQQKEKVA